jgi:hypothetical protein
MTGGIYEIHILDGLGLGIQVILRLLPQEFERFQCWYYAVEMVSG